MAQRDRRRIKPSPLHLISAETAQLDNAHVSAVQIPGRTATGKDAAGIARTKYRGADRGLPPKTLEQLLRRFFDMPDHFRLGIGVETATLAEGLDRLAEAVKKF